MPEIFKTIPGLDLLLVSNQGYVIRKEFYRNNHSKKILVPEIILSNILGNNGYFYINYIGKRYLLSRILASAFLGLDINNTKIFVCHKDDNPKNNSIENLFLGTCKENHTDMMNKGRMAVNEMLPHTRLNSDMVNFIRDSKGKIAQTKLGKMFNTGQPHISKIISNNRRNYA